MNRKTFIITSVAVSATIIISLSIGLPLYYHYKSIHYPPITIVSYELNPTAGEEWKLNVSTWLSSTCYYMKSPVIEFSKKHDFTVFISIKAKYSRFNRGLLCDFDVINYDYQFQITYPRPGNWTVHCNDKTITIYVQEPCFC